MKRFTLIFSLLMAVCFGVKAQEVYVTDLNDLDSEKTYLIESQRCILINSAGVAGSIATTNGTSVGTVKRDFTDNNQLFKIEKDGENYYLYSVGAGKYVTAGGAWSDTKGTALTLTDVRSANAGYPWKLSLGSNYLNSQNPNQTEAGIIVNGWSQTDQGNCYRIVDIAASTPEVVITEAADLNNNKVYTMVTTRGWLIYNSANPDVVASTASYTTFATGADVPACQWAIYKSATTSKYYLYNIGAGKFVGQNTEEGGRFPFVTEVTNDIQVVESTTGTEYAFVFSTDNYGAINHFNHPAEPGVANWKGNATSGGLRSLNDAGSAHRLVEVDDIDPSVLEAIAAAVADFENNTKIITYNFMYNGNLVATQKTEVEKGEAYPAINVQAPYGVTPVAADLAFMSGTVTGDETIEIGLEVTKELPFETAASANAISTWYLVRMHTNQPGYIGDIAEDNTVNVAPGKSSDVANENYIWGFVGDVFSGITVVNKGTGKKLTSTGSGNVTLTNEGTPFFVAETSETTPNAANGFCLRRNDSNQYLNAYYGNVGKLNHWDSTDAGSTFFLSEYEEDVVTVSEAGWATMYLGYQAYIPAGVNVYAVTGVENGWVTKSLLEGVIPANTGVLLENEGNFTFKRAAKDVNALEGNLMNGSVEDTYVEGTAYVLANRAGTGVGMYKAELNKDAEGNVGETHFKNNAGKAYMVLPAASETVAFYGLDWDGTTGIDEITDNRVQSTVIYDLTGRRVENIAAPGIYIVNGKKVLVK